MANDDRPPDGHHHHHPPNNNNNNNNTQERINALEAELHELRLSMNQQRQQGQNAPLQPQQQQNASLYVPPSQQPQQQGQAPPIPWAAKPRLAAQNQGQNTPLQPPWQYAPSPSQQPYAPTQPAQDDAGAHPSSLLTTRLSEGLRHQPLRSNNPFRTALEDTTTSLPAGTPLLQRPSPLSQTRPQQNLLDTFSPAPQPEKLYPQHTTSPQYSKGLFDSHEPAKETTPMKLPATRVFKHKEDIFTDSATTTAQPEANASTAATSGSTLSLFDLPPPTAVIQQRVADMIPEPKASADAHAPLERLLQRQQDSLAPSNLERAGGPTTTSAFSEALEEKQPPQPKPKPPKGKSKLEELSDAHLIKLYNKHGQEPLDLMNPRTKKTISVYVKNAMNFKVQPGTSEARLRQQYQDRVLQEQRKFLKDAGHEQLICAFCRAYDKKCNGEVPCKCCVDNQVECRFKLCDGKQHCFGDKCHGMHDNLMNMWLEAFSKKVLALSPSDLEVITQEFISRHKWELPYDAIMGRKLTSEERKIHHSAKLPMLGSALKKGPLSNRNGWTGTAPPEWVQKAFKDLNGFRDEMKQRFANQKTELESKDGSSTGDQAQAKSGQESAALMRVDKRLRNPQNKAKPQEEMPLSFVQKHEPHVGDLKILKTFDEARYNELLAMFRDRKAAANAQSAQEAAAAAAEADHKKSEDDARRKQITKDITGMDTDHDSKDNDEGRSNAEPDKSTSEAQQGQRLEGPAGSPMAEEPEKVDETSPAPDKASS